jgi:hypothetical protein
VVITDDLSVVEKMANRRDAVVVCTSAGLASRLQGRGLNVFTIEEFAPRTFDSFDQLCDHYRAQVERRFRSADDSADEFAFRVSFSQLVLLLAPALYLHDVVGKIRDTFGVARLDIAVHFDKQSRIILKGLVENGQKSC